MAYTLAHESTIDSDTEQMDMQLCALGLRSYLGVQYGVKPRLSMQDLLMADDDDKECWWVGLNAACASFKEDRAAIASMHPELEILEEWEAF